MTDLAPSSSVTSSSSSTSSSAIPQPSVGSKPWRTNKSLSSKHTATSTSTSTLSIKQENQASTTTAHTTTNGASKQAGSAEAPAKAASQKSMLEKLKLFNSKGGSKGGSSSQPAQQTSGDSGSSGGGSGGALRDSGIVVDRVEAGSNTDLMLEESEGNVRPVNGSSHSSAATTTAVTVAMTTSSPKIALKGIAQRTFSRALTAKKSSVKSVDKEKEKDRSAKDKDKERAKESSKRTSVPERGGEVRDGEPREENGTGGGSTTTEAEPKRASKIASFIPKGGKSAVAKKEASAATAHSGIPKPGAKASSGMGAGQGKGVGAPSGGKDGERPRSMRLGGGLALHRDSRHSSSSSSLASTEGKGQQCHSAAPVANAASNTVSVQLPQPQQQYSHPNTATVAPFMYR